VITTGYDTAGRASGVSGMKSGVPKTYASGVLYAPQGALSALTLGNGLAESIGYNTRLQMNSLTASMNGVTRLGLAYAYPAGTNNGNLQSQTISYPTNGSEAALSLTQNYGYDALNRLTNFGEGSIGETYDYDRYGNRWVSAHPNYQLSNLTPIANWFAPSTNRITQVNYDGRGNQTQLDPFTLAYDGENRQKSAVSQSNGSASYEYDGEGRRVRKLTCSGGAACTPSSPDLVTTVYVYDAFGHLAAEYSPVQVATGTEFLTADHLGSTRLVTDESGAVKRRYDYLPFGEGLDENYNGRSAMYSIGAFPKPPDGQSVKFTSKERDPETGLDYFGFRQMSAAQGRFTSVDPSFESEILEYPQTWNRYAYVYNNPLRFRDPDGACPNCVAAAIGAGIGGLIEGGISLGTQLYQNGGDFSDVSWAEVGASAAGGAVAGGLAGFTLGGSLVADIAVGGIANVAGGVVERAVLQTSTGDLTVDPFSGDDVAADFVAGAVGGAVGHAVAERAADLIHAPEVGPYPRKGRNFRNRLKDYNNRVAAQQRRAVEGFAVGTAVEKVVTRGVGNGLNGGFGGISHLFDWLFSSPPQQPIITTRICYPDENGNQVCQ
jgi:RHS repeat-associated protein